MIVKELFIKGLILGISVAIAIGPIALLCIQRTISHGFKVGFSTGLGAATADGLYGLIAGTGLAVITDFLMDYQGIIAGIGSLFLFWLGVSTFKSLPTALSEYQTSNVSLLHSFGSSFLLTLSSPMTILMFTAIFAGFGLMGTLGSNTFFSLFSLVSGVIMGSTIWWLILSGTIKLIREKLSQKAIIMINRISGILLLGFGCFALVKASIHMTLS